MGLKADSHDPTSAIFCLYKMHSQKFGAMSNRLVWICFGMQCAYLGVSVFWKCFRSFWKMYWGFIERKRSQSLYDTQIYLGQILVKKGRILVRFLGKIGQIVSQILENFSQFLITSTLDEAWYKAYTLGMFKLASTWSNKGCKGNRNHYILPEYLLLQDRSY